MNILIVSAHPEPKSFTIAMRDHSIKWLEESGHEVIQSDLYKMNFNPVASADDFSNRNQADYLKYALEQRYGWEDGSIAPDIKAELEKLLWCDVLILNFPLYWFSVPAILKGWIDRTLISGVTYGGKRFYENGGLAGKKALLAFTLGGRDYMFGEKGIHGELNTMLRPLLRGAFHYVGMDVLPPFAAFHVPYITDEDRQEILVQYRNYILNLQEMKILEFPKMLDFDEKLMPR